MPQTERLAPCPPVGEEKSVRLSVQTLRRRIVEPGKQRLTTSRGSGKSATSWVGLGAQLDRVGLPPVMLAEFKFSCFKRGAGHLPPVGQSLCRVKGLPFPFPVRLLTCKSVSA